MADVAGPRPVPESDLRSRVVALLLASDGAVLGGATVLSSDKAVTTAEVARSALERVEALAGTAPRPRGPLMLAFPQFRGSPGLYPVPVEVQSVDGERGFGILNLLVSAKNSGAFPAIELPAPVPSGLLGSGEIPAQGSGCDVLYLEERQPNQFFLLCLSGRVGAVTVLRLRLDLDGSPPASILGAPVLKDSLLVGIVTSAPHRAFDPTESGRGFDTSLSVEVLSVAAMADSEVTPAVRNLLARRGADPVTSRPHPTGMGIRQIDGSEGLESSGERPPEGGSTGSGPAAAVSATLTLTPNKESGAAPTELSDAELLGRFSPSSREALERANQIRNALALPRVHIEHLIYGLFEKPDGSTRQLFQKQGIDQRALNRILFPIMRADVGDGVFAAFEKLESAGLPRPAWFREFPPLSAHVREAVLAAVRRADEWDDQYVRSRHLLYGVLSVKDCGVVEELSKHGVSKDVVVRDEQPDISSPPSLQGPTDTPRSTRYLAAVSPTPKVDSDLWSEVDRLGYEAYARTIASLITHKETNPPLTIGIKAPWGAGKTTLMKRVQHLLDGYAKLSEENRTGTMQQGQPSQVTLRELLKELKNSATPARLEAKRSKDGEAYGLEPRATVWFNAWKYQTSEQIWAGMAHCIISQVTARMKVKDRELFWVRLHARRINADEVRAKVYEMIARQLLPLALVVGVVVAIVIWVTAGIQFLLPYHSVIKGVSLLAGVIVLVGKGWGKLGDKAAGAVRDLIREPDYEGKMGYLHLVESDIREVLQLATAASATQAKPEGNPLVVFVDDLDRCAPNKVAEVVEAINLFLCGDYPNCIFVIGMEPGMVAAALEVANKDVIRKATQMGLVDATAPVGWRFMEKVVQLPIMIPPPTSAARNGYIFSLTGWGREGVTLGDGSMGSESPSPPPLGSRPPQHGAEEEAKVQNYITRIGPVKSASDAAKKGEDIVAHAPLEELWAAQEAGNRIYERALSVLDPVMAVLIEEVAQLVEGNPRQIKRYVNVFRFYCALRHSLRLGGAIPSEDLPSDQVLAKFVALSIQWPHAVDCLRVRVDGADGGRVSLLKLLEAKSKEIAVDNAAADSAWEEFVGEGGLGMGAWAGKRAFREFLSRGESLCTKEGHGLW
jgi:hypothetical protein